MKTRIIIIRILIGFLLLYPLHFILTYTGDPFLGRAVEGVRKHLRLDEVNVQPGMQVNTVEDPLRKGHEKVISFPAEALTGLAPTAAELDTFKESRTGWSRTIHVSNHEEIPVVVNHYQGDSDSLRIRARLQSDDFSLLTLVSARGQIRGHVTIPGEASYGINNSGTDVILHVLDDHNWKCDQPSYN